MMLLSRPPGPDEPDLTDYYRRCAAEGSVFCGTVGDQSYGLSDSFDPAWSVAAVCWCAGGTETYDFVSKGTIRLKAGAALAIGENERYAWSSAGEQPFVSSMIVFPAALTRALRNATLDAEQKVSVEAPLFRTGLFKPGQGLMVRLNALARAASNEDPGGEAIEEQATLVASELRATQGDEARRPDRIESVKRSTREELSRRLRRAVTLMHDAYNDSTLDLETLAREACIARHHFVRVFSAAYGFTPLRYLVEIRMEAAARLLENMDLPTSEIAHAVGFSNRSAFHRRFQRHFGKTPKDWRTRR